MSATQDAIASLVAHGSEVVRLRVLELVLWLAGHVPEMGDALQGSGMPNQLRHACAGAA